MALAGPRKSWVFQFSLIFMFIVLLSAGFASRRHSGAHKRFMLLATLTLLPPAIARAHIPLLPHTPVGANLGALLFLIPLFAYDWATRRSLHPALLWGGGFCVLMLPLRILVRDYVFRN